MGHLMAVKDKQPVADNMFEPLKETIELLKTYGQELPDEVHQQLQVCTSHFVYIKPYTSYSACKKFSVFCVYMYVLKGPIMLCTCTCICVTVWMHLFGWDILVH